MDNTSAKRVRSAAVWTPVPREHSQFPVGWMSIGNQGRGDPKCQLERIEGVVRE